MLPNNFQTTNPPAFSSYSWSELSTATAYKNFYPIRTAVQDAALTTYTYTNFLCENSNLSSDYVIGGSYSTFPYDIDFDITFTRPAHIQGTAYFKYTFDCYADSSKNFYATFTLYHVDGATSAETSLGTITNYEQSLTTRRYIENSHKIELTAKNFKIGDKLRLTVYLQLVTATSSHNVYIYCNPKGESMTDAGGNTVTTDFILSIPFKIPYL
jgi:hypothetical protein